MRRLLRVTIALSGGALLAAACYWAFLNTPESRAWLLLLSAAMLLGMLLAASVSVTTALLLASGHDWKTSLARAIRAIHLFVIGAATASIGIWAIGRIDTWLASNSGPISAWFIDTFNWGDVRWLFRTESYVSEWLRWLVLPLAALAMVEAMLAEGVRSVVSRRWLRTGWHWRTLIVATLAYVVLMRLPWRWIAWRPPNLPPTWIEPAFAALRLGAIVALTLLGVAVTTTALARRSTSR